MKRLVPWMKRVPLLWAFVGFAVLGFLTECDAPVNDDARFYVPAAASYGTNRTCRDVLACVIEAVGTAPPRNAAAADPSASMSTAPACVPWSGEKSS